MTKLSTLVACPKKAYFGEMKLKSDKSVFSYYEEVIRSILKKARSFRGLMYPANVMEALEKTVPESAFSMKTERNENLSRVCERIVRMGCILWLNGFEYEGDGAFWSKMEGNKSIGGSYTFVASDSTGKYAVKVSFGDVPFSMKKETKSWIGLDPDLYVCQRATGLIPALFALNGNEKASGEVKDYEHKDMINPKKWVGRFWYAYDFSADHAEAEKALNNLIAIPVTRNAEENKKSCMNCWYKDLCQIEDTDNFIDDFDGDVTVAETKPIVWTDSQKTLINFREGEIRVFAVAGSGKTSSLSQLVINLRQDGIDPRAITLATFTEKGVREIKEKIQKRIVEQNLPFSADEFNVMTLNGLGYFIIKLYCAMKKLPVPELADESWRIHALAEIMDNHPVIDGLNYCNPFMKLFMAEGAVQKMSRIIDIIKRTAEDQSVEAKTVMDILSKEDSMKFLRDADDVMDPVRCGIIAHIYNDLRNKEMAENVITYDDQIHRATRLLQENPDLLNKARGYTQCLIVDEFQDTGIDQMKMVELLYAPGRNHLLAVVGDRNQSIMGFRGVGNENIIRFNKVYPNAVTVDMNDNFRSTRQICEVGENILSEIGENASLNTEKSGNDVVMIPANSREEGVQKAVDEVLNWIDDGVELKDIAIICRTRSEILMARNLLKDNGIPNVVSVSEYLKDDNQVIGAINLAAYLTDRTRLKELAIWLRHSDRDGFDSAIDLSGYIALHAAMLEEDFRDLDDAGMYEKFMEKLHTAFDLKLTNSMKTYFRIEEGKTHSFNRAAGYLEKLAESNSNLGAEKDETVYNAVSLTTVHSAKGREWNNVAVCANGHKEVSGLACDMNKMVSLKYDEEEIRTFFVAVTRAKENLVITGNEYWLSAARGVTEVSMDNLKASGVSVKDPFAPKPKKTKN